jgi:ADP-ribose pyrophosphatase YjhB (NUDIX family)
VSKKPRRRTDYWDDPHAPKPTSRKPSASVVLRNHRGELLLLRRAGSGSWTIPTGALKKKETVTACAVRECREETGLTVELTGLVGVFSDPRHRIAYPGGEVRVPVNVCFHGQPVSGELATDSESEEAAWVAPEDLDGYDIHPAIRRRLSHALNGTVPHVDLTAAGRGTGMDAVGCWVSARGCWFRLCWGRRGIRVVYGARSAPSGGGMGRERGCGGKPGATRAVGGCPRVSLRAARSAAPGMRSGCLQASTGGRRGAVCARAAQSAAPWTPNR